MAGACWVGLVAVWSAAAPPADAEGRALSYLSREVPRWSAENKCFSCHNNGDAARALYAAVRLSRPVPERALADTTRWLSRPGDWDCNRGYEMASDKVLARIQFTVALLEALDAGLLKDREPLARAAELMARDQRPDGSWKVDADGAVGSPATYGTALATYLARRSLHRADHRRFKDAVARADRWFRAAKPAAVLESAAVLLGLGNADDPAARAQRERCLELIRKGQGQDGGWGPYVTSAAEPFDTAVVLLALTQNKDGADRDRAVRCGREYLLAMQKPDGSWPETTRPAGAESYAQRLSTAGWATLALLATAR